MKTYTRRGFLKKLVGLTAAGLITAFGGYSYARYLEPKMIDITSFDIKHKQIPKAFNGTKIVQISDTHMSDFFTLSHLKKVLNEVNDLKPDIVFFTGDLMDEPNVYTMKQKVVEELNRLKAPLGKFAIYGNHDHGGYGTDIYHNMMAMTDFILLKNQYHEIKLLDGSMIQLAGIDDLMLGKPDYEKTLSNFTEENFSILLAHEPDAALESNKYKVNLQISGHSHGGQIQIPFYGPLITPPYASVYTEGMYEVGTMQLYVNRGLGTTRLPFRFLSVPEITVFTLKTG
ncbi:metallophosphoesterase [Metabacillus arenae]|uniref:Metallophosphoesterase n=1 Tax=Metabacillus arenae TaxID=2771434 RepID=A0A926RWY0_9BACI|nr:metallophosphoesterase [Metabacillus arenae]MBD1381273.1 metallophosphoesterase [Metabacillus arenae]